MIPTQWPANLGCTLNPQAPPEALALIDLSDPQRERAWSYGEFSSRCDAVARGLRKAGLARGD
jgi:non-ribosomal peptide synthetase component E (peptide arylation enzyme)